MPKPEGARQTSPARGKARGKSEGDQGASLPLYHRILGDSFDALPVALRRFHSLPRGGTAHGTLRVTHGKGRLRSKLATVLRLPPEGDHVPLRLHVAVEGEREHWQRDFGGVRLTTLQWAWRGLLVEGMGPLRWGFRLTACPGSLRFDRERAWLGALPLPAVLAPRITAIVTEAGPDSWNVTVRVAAPILGLLVAYEGKVTLP